MTEKHAETRIRERKADTYSVEDQCEICHAMWRANIAPTHEGIKRTELEDRLGLDLEHTVKTSLKHLVEIDMVEEFTRPGPSTFVVATWMEDGIVNGEVDEAADEGVEALIDHMQDEEPPETGDAGVAADGSGATIRHAVATAFELVSDAVEDHLRSGDQVEKLNDAVQAIQDHEELSTRDDYGEILFLNAAYRYRLTEEAVAHYERGS